MYQYNRGYQLTINDRETGTLYTLDGSIGDDGLRIKFEIENTYRALSNVIPAAERSELNQRLKDLKAAYKAVNLFGGQ